MKKVEIKILIRVFSILLHFEAFFLLLSMGISLLYGEKEYIYFLISAAAILVVSIPGVIFTRGIKAGMGKREGFLIVSLIWIIFTFFGMMPFYLSGSIPNFVDAFLRP